jgi:ribonuclease HI
VWSRARPAKGDCKIRGFEQEGKAIFCGKVKRKKQEHEALGEEDEIESEVPDDKVEECRRASRQKGWWKCGDVEAKLNTVNMTAWVHKECDIIKTGALTKLQEAWDSSEQKDECMVCLDDLERAYWMSTEIGQLGGYGFQGMALGVDGSCKDGRMGAGCCKFRKDGEDRRARVGREEEGASSNRPELGGVVLALQSAALSEDALVLCDNEAVLRVIKKWVGQGGKATLATAPDADILREIVCLLTQRVRAGRATFLIKVKSHRGEPINERADTLAEEGRGMSDDDKRWDDRTDRMTFEVRRGDATVSSAWTNSVRNAFRKQAGWANCREQERQQQSNGQLVCGIVTTNAGYRHHRKERRLQRAGVSKIKGSGARSALKIWIREEWGDLRRALGARTFFSEKG